MKKKTFMIIIPMTYTINIEAESEEEALDKYSQMKSTELDEQCDISYYPDVDSVEVECYEE